MINLKPDLASSIGDANLFDRLSLQFTVKLIRGHSPSLALRIQNIIAPSLSTSLGEGKPPAATDVFDLALDSSTLKQVVETIAVAGQELAEQVLLTEHGDLDYLLSIKEVIGHWLLYARQHQIEEQLCSTELL